MTPPIFANELVAPSKLPKEIMEPLTEDELLAIYGGPDVNNDPDPQ